MEEVQTLFIWVFKVKESQESSTLSEPKISEEPTSPSHTEGQGLEYNNDKQWEVNSEAAETVNLNDGVMGNL
jgi:hypothetical protein